MKKYITQGVMLSQQAEYDAVTMYICDQKFLNISAQRQGPFMEDVVYRWERFGVGIDR